MIVREASSKERKERDKLTFHEWGTKLPLDAFLEREDFLRSHPFSQENMKTWLLEDKNQILSSCETFRMKSQALGNNGTTYGIASVYTAPSLRGNKYAAILIEKVIAHLKDIDSNLQSFILFSEVGASLYERLYFQPVPSFELVFEAASKDSRVRFLNRKETLSLFAQRKYPLGRFTILPTSSQIDWHFARESFYAEKLNRERLSFSGATIGNSLLIWQADHKIDCLRALHFEADSLKEAEELIHAAVQVAITSGLKEFRVWAHEIFQNAEAISLPKRKIELKDCLAMIRLEKPSLTASDWKVLSRAVWI